ncbi:MAG: DUF4392 domain-containing protein [Gemmatales bacterium]|nr:DUF4392 domain-containing protein [Gemmatales bacterium]MDW7993294.1 DUF4392 domain-containing protein [Gemmatales bacterium]
MPPNWAEPILQVVWHDLARRGLDRVWPVPQRWQDFEDACTYLVNHGPAVSIVTGFFIPQSSAWESDGPPGAIFLGRCLDRLGQAVCFYAEETLADILRLALDQCHQTLPVSTFPATEKLASWWQQERFRFAERQWCLISVERPGPAHTPISLARQTDDPHVHQQFLATVPPADWDRLHTMSALDVTSYHWPVHLWLEQGQVPLLAIGDGGNELGMGKIPWQQLAQYVPQGARIACRISADWLIIATVSNWAAYALAAALCLLHNAKELFLELANPDQELQLWRKVCQTYPLCDGLTGQPACRNRDFFVDGLPWHKHALVLTRLTETIRG